MTSIEQLKAARESALSLTQHGAPQATSNQFLVLVQSLTWH